MRGLPAQVKIGDFKSRKGRRVMDPVGQPWIGSVAMAAPGMNINTTSSPTFTSSVASPATYYNAATTTASAR